MRWQSPQMRAGLKCSSCSCAKLFWGGSIFKLMWDDRGESESEKKWTLGKQPYGATLKIILKNLYSKDGRDEWRNPTENLRESFWNNPSEPSLEQTLQCDDERWSSCWDQQFSDEVNVASPFFSAPKCAGPPADPVHAGCPLCEPSLWPWCQSGRT